MKKKLNKLKKVFLKINMWYLGYILEDLNQRIGEGGVISWSLLNFKWECEFGTYESAKKQRDLFAKFVDKRFEKFNSLVK